MTVPPAPNVSQYSTLCTGPVYSQCFHHPSAFRSAVCKHTKLFYYKCLFTRYPRRWAPTSTAARKKIDRFEDNIAWNFLLVSAWTLVRWSESSIPTLNFSCDTGGFLPCDKTEKQTNSSFLRKESAENVRKNSFFVLEIFLWVCLSLKLKRTMDFNFHLVIAHPLLLRRHP